MTTPAGRTVVAVDMGPVQAVEERRVRTFEVAFSAGTERVAAYSVAEAVGAARQRLIDRDPFCGRMATYIGTREP